MRAEPLHAKYRARQIIRNALYTGALAKPLFCEECDAHDQNLLIRWSDYRQPYDIRWMCSMCYLKHMAEHGEAANANYIIGAA